MIFVNVDCEGLLLAAVGFMQMPKNVHLYTRMWKGVCGGGGGGASGHRGHESNERTNTVDGWNQLFIEFR